MILVAGFRRICGKILCQRTKFNQSFPFVFTEFLLGTLILAAPVLRQGQNSRHIYLPRGTWLDGNTNVTYEGPRWLMDYPAPLDTLPYFKIQTRMFNWFNKEFISFILFNAELVLQSKLNQSVRLPTEPISVKKKLNKRTHVYALMSKYLFKYKSNDSLPTTNFDFSRYLF